MWEKQARADSVKQRNHIIANSGIRVSQEQQSLMAAAQNAVKKWNTFFLWSLLFSCKLLETIRLNYKFQITVFLQSYFLLYYKHVI